MDQDAHRAGRFGHERGTEVRGESKKSDGTVERGSSRLCTGVRGVHQRTRRVEDGEKRERERQRGQKRERTQERQEREREQEEGIRGRSKDTCGQLPLRRFLSLQGFSTRLTLITRPDT